MATYKVPQDVEADDKLLGPLTFRQFVYLMIAFGLSMLAFGLFQIFPLLGIIPIPFILFLAVLALPIKKDQPMETYLAALLSFYTKPNKRYWIPGQSESTILITAPKKVEVQRARNLSGEEASHRLSFLAEIVDSEGHAIKDANTIMKDDFYTEAYNTTDMFERGQNYNLDTSTTAEDLAKRAEVLDSMRSAIATSEFNSEHQPTIRGDYTLTPHQDFNVATANVQQAAAELGSSDTAAPVFSPTSTPDLPPAAANNAVVESIQEQADRILRENES